MYAYCDGEGRVVHGRHMWQPHLKQSECLSIYVSYVGATWD